MKTVLVTGGAGFIGSHLCERLLELGHKVVCFDNMATGRKENLAKIKDHPNFTLLIGDTNNTEHLKDVFRYTKFDWVFHYAAVVGVKRTEEDPVAVLNDIEGIKSICEMCKFYGVDRLCFSSSSEVYGEPKKLPEAEDDSLDARMPYAQVKAIGESFLKAYHEKYGLKTVSLRFFNVYGPRQESSDYGFVVGIFIKRALKGKNPIVFGDGTQTREFVFIEDNINAAIAAMESDKTPGKIINIGNNLNNGKGTRIIDLANTIIKIMGKEGELKPEFAEDKNNRVTHRLPSKDVMNEFIAYKCKYDLVSGLKKTIQYYLEQD